MIPTELTQTTHPRGWTRSRTALAVSALLTTAFVGHAQTTAMPSAPPPAELEGKPATPPVTPALASSATAADDDETIVLSPFEVTAAGTTGYYAANSMSGTRFNTKVEDLATSITIVTKEQMADFAMLDVNDVFLYTANTEGTGTYTDYAIDRNGSVQDNVQINPTQANRVRGIAPANVSLNNIETMGWMPIDPSTMEGVEVSRGPNANVFGLGNPSGTVNQVPATANLSRDRGTVGMRADDLGGYRFYVDVNKRLLDGKLAVRGSAVLQHDAFVRKPSGVDVTRYNGMIKWQPFPRTTLSASIFHYNMEGNRPNMLPPRDNVSYWIRAGRPTWDPVTRTIHVNGTTLGPYPAAATGNYNGPDYFSTGLLGGNSSQLFIDRDGINYWSAPQGYTSATNPGTGPQSMIYVQTTGIEGATGTAARPSAQPLFTTTPTVSDRSIYNWEKINIASPNRVEDTVRTTNVQLDHIFISQPDQTLALQVGAMEEKGDRYQRNLIGISNDNGQSGQLMVDVNERRLDGTANPYFLRTYIGTDRPRTTEIPARWLTYRAQTAYRLDLTRRDNWLKWLGVLQATGYYEYKDRKNRQYSYREAMIDTKSWLPAGIYRGTQAAPAGTPAHIRLPQSLQRYYVGDAEGGDVDYAPGTLSLGSYNYVWGNAASGVFNAEPTVLGMVGADKTGGTFNTKKYIKTMGAVFQGTFLDNRLVLAYGVREDDVYNQFGNTTTRFLNPDGMTFNRDVTDAWDGVWRFNSGRTTNTQVVARPLKDVGLVRGLGRNGGAGEFLADVLDGMSLYYNQSDSFIPADPAQDILLNILPNPTGEEESYGLGFNYKNKVVLRVTWYENKQLNSRNGDANTISQRVIRTDLPLIGATPARFMLYNVAGATVANASNYNRLGWIKVQNPTWTDAQVAAELSRVMGLSQEYMDALINPTPPIAATQDVIAKGTELEINVNPTYYWTISASATDTRTINENVSSALEEWINQRMPVWTSLVDPTVAATAANPNQLWWKTRYPSATQSAEENFLAFVWTPYNVLKQLEGKSNPQVRRYNFRLSSNLKLAGVSDNEVLKKFSIGGAVRWEDKGAIGYYGVQQLPTTITDLDTSRPIYDKSHTYLDAFLSYKTKLGSEKLSATFQLNVRNVTESGGLRPVGAFPDGTPHTYRIIDPRQFILSATFDL